MLEETKLVNKISIIHIMVAFIKALIVKYYFCVRQVIF